MRKRCRDWSVAIRRRIVAILAIRRGIVAVIALGCIRAILGDWRRRIGLIRGRRIGIVRRRIIGRWRRRIVSVCWRVVGVGNRIAIAADLTAPADVLDQR